MIVRMWSGQVKSEDAEEYEAYMQETGLPGYARVSGNRGILMLRRSIDDRVEFFMVTLWDSLESIMAFAGDDHETAVFYPRDEEFLVQRDDRVRHYEVLTAQNFSVSE